MVLLLLCLFACCCVIIVHFGGWASLGVTAIGWLLGAVICVAGYAAWHRYRHD